MCPPFLLLNSLAKLGLPFLSRLNHLNQKHPPIENDSHPFHPAPVVIMPPLRPTGVNSPRVQLPPPTWPRQLQGKGQKRGILHFHFLLVLLSRNPQRLQRPLCRQLPEDGNARHPPQPLLSRTRNSLNPSGLQLVAHHPLVSLPSVLSRSSGNHNSRGRQNVTR